MIDGRRKRVICKAADDILSNNNSFRAGFEVVELVEKLGIRFTPVSEMDGTISGFSIFAPDKRVIALRQSELGTPRGRFTIAHELGHLTLHQNSAVNYGKAEVFFRHIEGPEKLDWKEYEANYFAACLLMPESLVHEEAGRFAPEEGLSGYDVEVMASIFKVSVPAMTVRLSQLGYALY